MPISRLDQVPVVMDVVTALNPMRIVDVGTGCGKYGLLCRERLEFRDQRLPPPWTVHIDGIEGFAKYIQDYHHHIYDRVYIGDALQLLKEMPNHRYDVSLLIDVLEHFERMKGEQVLAELLRTSTSVVVSVPADFVVQGAEFGNPLEIHRTHWTMADLRRIAPIVIVRRIPSLVVVLSLDPVTLHTVRKQFRWQRRLYQALRARAARVRVLRFIYRALSARP